MLELTILNNLSTQEKLVLPSIEDIVSKAVSQTFKVECTCTLLLHTNLMGKGSHMHKGMVYSMHKAWSREAEIIVFSCP